MKKFVSSFLIGTIILSSSVVYAKTASFTDSDIFVDGKNVSLEAFNIDGNNYFKLRDIAMILNGTDSQFEIIWDSAQNSIDLITNKAYSPVGGELTKVSFSNKVAEHTSSKLYIDEKLINLGAYNIDDNNYFKLRDLAEIVNFSVDWDQENQNIIIDTSKEYSGEAQVYTDDVDVKNAGITVNSNITQYIEENSIPLSSVGVTTENTSKLTTEEEFINEVIRLTNEARKAHGVHELLLLDDLTKAADKRADEISVLFDHVRPNGEVIYTIYGEFGLTYRAAGENLCKGQRTPQEVFDSLYSSEGHRENLLSPNYYYVGVGFYDYHWAQLFLG